MGGTKVRLSNMIIGFLLLLPFWPAECMFVHSEDGIYEYISRGGTNEVCGLYLISEAHQLVEFQFESFDISCAGGGLLSVIDGWELNGQFFPGTDDHPLPRDLRYQEFCGTRRPQGKFTMHQNVGLLEFRIPAPGEGFRVRVTFLENPRRKSQKLIARFFHR